MSYGHIAKVHIDGLDLENYAQLCGVDFHAYMAEVNVAISDIENCYNDAVTNNQHIRRAQTDADKQVEFLDPSRPRGPYDLHITQRNKLRKIDWLDETKYKNEPSLILGFSTTESKEIFYEYILSFKAIEAALGHYHDIVDDSGFCKLGHFNHRDVITIIRNNLHREGGHEGVIATLFPLNFNHHLWGRGEKPDFNIDLYLACSVFSLMDSIFSSTKFYSETCRIKAFPMRPADIGPNFPKLIP